MTGRELIKWILDNEAETMKFEVQCRDDNFNCFGIDGHLLLKEDIGKDPFGWTYKRILL